MKFFLYSVWGSCIAGDRNACLEEFNTLEEALAGIRSVLDDHPDALYQLIEGTEITNDRIL